MQNELLIQQEDFHSVVYALRQELNINRNYRRILVFFTFFSILQASIFLPLIIGALWFSISAKADIDDSKQFLEINKKVLVDRIEDARAKMDELQHSVSRLHESQAKTRGKVKELESMRLRLIDMEVDLQVITGLIKSLRDGEVRLKAGTNDKGIRNLRE